MSGGRVAVLLCCTSHGQALEDGEVVGRGWSRAARALMTARLTGPETVGRRWSLPLSSRFSRNRDGTGLFFKDMSDLVPDDALSRFARQVRMRSQENRLMIEFAHSNELRASEVGILRLELESLEYVIYLLHEHDRPQRSDILVRLTSFNQRLDIKDEEIAQPTKEIYGWEGQLYKTSSRFIHLSGRHDYAARDPFQESLSPGERQEMTRFLNEYHGGNLSVNSTFAEVIDYVPKVFGKLADRLEFYLGKLERDEDL